MNTYELDRVTHEFKMYFPTIFEKGVKYTGNDFGELIVKLEDGSYISYDTYEHTIRNLPRDDKNMSENECRREFSIRLYKTMIRKGMAQNELSERTGISEVTISKYMNGKATPSFYNVDKIAKALNCSVEDLRYRNI